VKVTCDDFLMDPFDPDQVGNGYGVEPSTVKGIKKFKLPILWEFGFSEVSASVFRPRK